MKYLIDTNVLSEALRRRPDANVSRWFETADDSNIHLSVVTIAEIRKGLMQLDPGKRRTRLDHWLTHELLEQYAGRIFDIDLTISVCWGDIAAQQHAAGKVVNIMDIFLAATAIVHDCVLVTRNVKDFTRLNVRLYNPWDGSVPSAS